MADGAITKRPARKRLPFLARLRQRWQRGATVAAAPRPTVKTPAPKAAARSRPALPPDPLTIRQWLYGSGFTIPGDADYVRELVKPFHLGPSMTMLDLAAGLGGPARAIAQAFDTYVTGLERDPELARRATEETAARGLSRHVQITAYDPETFELRAGFYDHALAREATYHVAQKERFLRVLNQAMKPLGQLILTDFVRDRTVGDAPELAAWEAVQPFKPQLWTAAQYTDCFKSLGFDLRIANDITAEYRRLVVLAWKAFVEEGELRQLRSKQALPVIDEVERSIKTIAALESGALKFHYFVALGGRRRAAIS
jgi:SAM-dependent methyltransferase